jgi:bacterioferritin-associated ferredoxin
MYICLCNSISDRTVRAVVAAGCRSVAQVYQAIGERPQCGKCVSQIRAMVRSGGGEDCPAYAAAAE